MLPDLEKVVSVCSDVRPVLSVHEVGLHLGHCQVHFLPIYQSNARTEPGKREEKVTESSSRLRSVLSPRHFGVMNSVHEIILGDQRGHRSSLPGLPQRVGKDETTALEFFFTKFVEFHYMYL